MAKASVGLKAEKRWYYNIIFNQAKSKYSKTTDTELSRKFVDLLIQKTEEWGFNSYFDPDRNAVPGNIFDELFYVIENSTFTIVIITKEYNKNKWVKYCGDAAVKKRMDDDENSFKNIIGVLVGVDEKSLPKSLVVSAFVSFTDINSEWQEDENSWNRLHDLMGDDSLESSQSENSTTEKLTCDGPDAELIYQRDTGSVVSPLSQSDISQTGHNEENRQSLIHTHINANHYHNYNVTLSGREILTGNIGGQSHQDERTVIVPSNSTAESAGTQPQSLNALQQETSDSRTQSSDVSSLDSSTEPTERNRSSPAAVNQDDGSTTTDQTSVPGTGIRHSSFGCTDSSDLEEDYRTMESLRKNITEHENISSNIGVQDNNGEKDATPAATRHAIDNEETGLFLQETQRPKNLQFARNHKCSTGMNETSNGPAIESTVPSADSGLGPSLNSPFPVTSHDSGASNNTENSTDGHYDTEYNINTDGSTKINTDTNDGIDNNVDNKSGTDNSTDANGSTMGNNGANDGSTIGNIGANNGTENNIDSTDGTENNEENSKNPQKKTSYKSRDIRCVSKYFL